ncbi:MAG: cobalamin-dependent protein [Candidatus Lokiarchaeota archaeon]
MKKMTFNSQKELLEELLISLDRVKLTEFIIKLKKDYTKKEIINLIIVPTLERIGKLWEQGNLALSQVYMSGRLTEDMIKKLFDPSKKEKSKIPKVGLAVLEDHHALGSKILNFILQTYGIKAINYKVGISVQELAKKVVKDKIDIILISTLMLRSALKVKEFTELLNNHNNIKVIVGGAPFNFDKQLGKKVGADLVGHTAFDSIKLINKIIGDNYE